ncbi:MAG TPA: nuclear transport factor 2 family protein [Aldersonia sp.]
MIDQNEVRVADLARREAMIAADVPRLSELFADDMMWIHATARVDTKAGLLESIGSGKTKYLAIDISDETLRVINDLAFLSGIAVMKAEIAGNVRDIENRYTIVWQLDAGKWQVVNWQTTSVRKPS